MMLCPIMATYTRIQQTTVISMLIVLAIARLLQKRQASGRGMVACRVQAFDRRTLEHGNSVNQITIPCRVALPSGSD
jgi:hypothetical protein